MPAKQKSSGKRKPKKQQRGKGISLGDIASFVKDHKVISGVLGMIPYPAAQTAAAVARQVGLGRRSQRGAGIFSDLGGGIESVFGGIGSGGGSIAHDLFGGGRSNVHVQHLQL